MAECRADPKYIFVFFAAGTYYVNTVFISNFMSLWYESFEDSGIIEEGESSDMYQFALLLNCVCAFIYVPILGVIGDRVPTTWYILISYAGRAFFNCSFVLLETPESALAPTLIVLVSFFTTGEMISVGKLFYRSIPNKLRGVLVGAFALSSYTGKLIYCGTGGWLFDTLGRNAP